MLRRKVTVNHLITSSAPKTEGLEFFSIVTKFLPIKVHKDKFSDRNYAIKSFL